jgi:flagellum-specific ATP synthase
MNKPNLKPVQRAVKRGDPIKLNGRVTRVVGLVVESIGPHSSVSELCRINFARTEAPVEAEVVGFRENKVLLMPLGDMHGIGPGSEVISTGHPLSIGVGENLLGRVLDGLGNPLDGKGDITCQEFKSVYNRPPAPLERTRIGEPLCTRVRAIDGIITCGKGQRMGIFSGSGVGKSVLLGMIARKSDADVNIIALVGERGREVRDFIERDLGEEGLRKSVVIAVTSDRPALIRVKGALCALTIAEYFRDQGMDVLFMMDSLTRVAMAQREIGLAIGEPPATKGYPPSAFAMLPQLLERAGTSSSGSITGLYNVLVEADDLNEPVSDAVRAILDGHIVLTRKLAARKHYPAVDPLESVSRIMNDIVSDSHLEAARRVGQILATYAESEDLINIGAYVKGSNQKIDHAISKIDAVNEFLQQGMDEHEEFDSTVEKLLQLVDLPAEAAITE